MSRCKNCKWCNHNDFNSGRWYCANPNVSVFEPPYNFDECFEERILKKGKCEAISQNETEQIKLLECPLCGDPTELQEHKHRGNPSTFYVQCKSGCVRQFDYRDRKRAIENWNTRKPMERIVERLEEIKKNLVVNASSDYLAIHYALAIDSTIKVVKEEGGME